MGCQEGRALRRVVPDQQYNRLCCFGFRYLMFSCGWPSTTDLETWVETSIIIRTQVFLGLFVFVHNGPLLHPHAKSVEQFPEQPKPVEKLDDI